MADEDDLEEGSSESVSSFDDEGSKKVKDNYPSDFDDSEEEKEGGLMEPVNEFGEHLSMT